MTMAAARSPGRIDLPIRHRALLVLISKKKTKLLEAERIITPYLRSDLTTTDLAQVRRELVKLGGTFQTKLVNSDGNMTWFEIEANEKVWLDAFVSFPSSLVQGVPASSSFSTHEIPSVTQRSTGESESIRDTAFQIGTPSTDENPMDIKYEIPDTDSEQRFADINIGQEESVQKEPSDLEFNFLQCERNCETCQMYIRKLKEHVRAIHGVESQPTIQSDPLHIEIPYVTDHSSSNHGIKCKVEEVESMDCETEPEIMFGAGERNTGHLHQSHDHEWESSNTTGLNSGLRILPQPRPKKIVVKKFQPSKLVSPYVYQNEGEIVTFERVKDFTIANKAKQIEQGLPYNPTFCIFCPKSMTTQKVLWGHVTRMHLTEGHRCEHEECGYRAFSSPHALNLHNKGKEAMKKRVASCFLKGNG